MKFRKLVTTFSAVALMFGLAGNAMAADLRVGVEGAYPPFSWKESDGKTDGTEHEGCSTCQ